MWGSGVPQWAPRFRTVFMLREAWARDNEAYLPQTVRVAVQSECSADVMPVLVDQIPAGIHAQGYTR